MSAVIRPRPTSVAMLLGLLGVCFAVAAVGGASTAQGVRDWYPGLDKPPWTPPAWAFGPIWTALYTAMAVAAWDVWRRRGPRLGVPLGLFALQLGLNALWSPVFFAWHLTGVALGILTGLWVSIAACIVAFWPRSRAAAALMAPYLLWVSIAWSLNAWIVWFNP